MFPQFKKINNESGVVLFIVLMTAIIIMIWSLSILTESMNEINYAQQQIDQIASTQIAKGVFWNGYSNAFGTATAIGTVTNSGRTYGTYYNYNSVTSQVNVTTNFDTFQ